MSTSNNSDDVEEEDVYEVEAVVGQRKKKGRNEYLIKWKGYASDENTWEPVANLNESAREDARAYRKNKASSKKNPASKRPRLNSKSPDSATHDETVAKKEELPPCDEKSEKVAQDADTLVKEHTNDDEPPTKQDGKDELSPSDEEKETVTQDVDTSGKEHVKDDDLLTKKDHKDDSGVSEVAETMVMLSSSSATTTESKAWYGPPPPPELIDNASSLKLLSQGAEARVWLATVDISEANKEAGSAKRSVHVGSGINVPQLFSLSQHPSPLLDESPSSSSSQSVQVIVKERFPKKYRHPALDVSLTKSRTKGEARSLIRCKRADVACPKVLAIANWSNLKDGDGNGDKKSETSKTGSNVSTTASSCLFIEHVQGCTVRQYFEQRLESTATQEGGENTKLESKEQDRVTTVIDTDTLGVAYNIGTLVGKMHAAGVVHGDLTTSNIMFKNPPQPKDDNEETKQGWDADLVLIDFGLATSSNPTIVTAASNNDASNNGKKPHKQQHSAEEKAVDLYVLERAFLSTHPESEPLVEEVLKGYREFFEGLGSNNDGSTEGTYGHVAKAIFNRLEQVRLRGRKRECFG